MTKQDIKCKPVRLRLDLHKQLKAYCAIEGRTMEWVITKLVKDFLEKEKEHD